MAVGLYVAGRYAVDLLLKNHARKNSQHHSRRAVPPRFGHDVDQALVLNFHVFLEARDALRDFSFCTSGSARRNHCRMAEMLVMLLMRQLHILQIIQMEKQLEIVIVSQFQAVPAELVEIHKVLLLRQELAAAAAVRLIFTPIKHLHFSLL